ncbi:MAG: class I SAM-dependent methyltransferase [Ramlibacter sp.]|nr:class I SAM-dependent methyltransferase [Ramlibacter sp.]
MKPQAYVDMARVQHRHWWFNARREILRSRISALGLPAGARLLEIGSGTGGNLEMLCGFGRVVGVEMSQEAISFACRLAVVRDGRAQLVRGRCPEALDDIEGTFDLICLFDVLEHIAADSEVLRELSKLLAPGGRIMVTVPAYEWLWSEHDVDLHHFRRYNRGSLNRAFGLAGLNVTRLSHFNTLLFPLAVAARLLCKALGRSQVGKDMPSAPLNAVLRSVFAAERHILGPLDLPFGLSLLALATGSRAETRRDCVSHP